MRGLTRDGKNIEFTATKFNEPFCVYGVDTLNTSNRRVQGLRQCNPRKWWQEVKRFTGQSTRLSFDAMATDLFDGDFSRLANNINIFMQSVSSDLKPLDANLIPDACDACPDIFDPSVQGLCNLQYLVPDRPRTSQYENSFVIHALNNCQ